MNQALATHLKQCANKRKHGSQMTWKEKQIVYKKLRSVKVEEWKLSKHALDRLEEKEINATMDDIISTIYNSQIIEYKVDYRQRFNRYDERIVLRSKAVVNGCYNLGVVYSITSKYIVSVWMNKVNDNHETLNWEAYDKNMKIF